MRRSELPSSFIARSRIKLAKPILVWIFVSPPPPPEEEEEERKIAPNLKSPPPPLLH